MFEIIIIVFFILLFRQINKEVKSEQAFETKMREYQKYTNENPGNLTDSVPLVPLNDKWRKK